MTDRYILNGNEPVPCPDLMEWADWVEKADRKVAQTGGGSLFVSTVFLGLDHRFGEGPPMLFETMCFRDGEGDECEHCSTWEEAEAQHEKMCADVFEVEP